MKVTVYELIERSALAALPLQRPDGAMPAGHNGPWNDAETPLRNTGYWLATFIKAHDLTGKPAFLNAANRAADYLASPAARPMGGAFRHFEMSGKAGANGLIGQAWTIEALGIGCRRLARPELGTLAENVFLQHPFDYPSSLWSRLNVDGSVGTPMGVFNQQVWFAAAGASLITASTPDDHELRRRTERFVDGLHKYVRFGQDGIIAHNFDRPDSSRLTRFVRLFRRLRSRHRNYSGRTRDVGYHSFNLYGLARLKQAQPAHSVWTSGRLDPMWKAIDSGRFDRLAEGNPYCYVYNPSGIEIAFALEGFRRDTPGLAVAYLQTQFSRCFDFTTGFMEAGGAADRLTLAARLSEATRLGDHTLHL